MIVGFDLWLTQTFFNTLNYLALNFYKTKKKRFLYHLCMPKLIEQFLSFKLAILPIFKKFTNGN